MQRPYESPNQLLTTPTKNTLPTHYQCIIEQVGFQMHHVDGFIKSLRYYSA